jgi:hypothetical protein
MNEQQIQDLIRDGKLNPLRSGAGGKRHFRVDEVDLLAKSGAAASGDSDLDFMDALDQGSPSSPDDALSIEAGADVGLSESVGLGVSVDDEDLGLSETFLPPGTEPAEDEETAPTISEAGQVGVGSDIDMALGSDTGTDLAISTDSFGLADADASAQAPPPESQQISPTLGGADAVSIDDEEVAVADEKEDTVLTQVGINVFDTLPGGEIVVESDPLADTVIAPSSEDQATLEAEGAGSGSGLMEIAQEGDETSLGAELLDEYLPAGGEGGAVGVVESDIVGVEAVAEDEDEAGIEEVEVVEEAMGAAFGMAPREVEAPDPLTPAFTGLMIVAFVVMGIVTIAAASGLRGVELSLIEWLTDNVGLKLFAGATAIVCLVIGGVGAVVGKSTAARRDAFRQLGR